jgi:hypothetical protein
MPGKATALYPKSRGLVITDPTQPRCESSLLYFVNVLVYLIASVTQPLEVS